MNRKELRKAKRIVILCEGSSEEKAVNEFIRRQWEKDNLDQVGLHTIDLKGHLEKIHFNAITFLKDEKVIAVFTLIDLYEFKRVENKAFDSLEKRIEAAKGWLKKGLSIESKKCFYPHLSIYEVEAWILAEGKALANRLKSKAIHSQEKAEEKNDQNPPKNRLNALFHKHGKPDGYKEIRDGIPLFRNIDFSEVYDSCPYFKKFYDDLKSVAQRALGESSIQ